MIFLLLIVILIACSKAEVVDVQIPEIWTDKVERGDALYSKDQSGGLMPEVGNRRGFWSSRFWSFMEFHEFHGFIRSF